MTKECKWILKEPADAAKVSRLAAELGIDGEVLLLVGGDGLLHHLLDLAVEALHLLALGCQLLAVFSLIL